VPRSRMAVLCFIPPYAFIAWCLIN
jgi:hypothetical protein